MKNQSATSESNFDVKKLDDESQFILEKFKEGYTTMELKQLVMNFVEVNVKQCEGQQYKNSYFAYKKLVQVMGVAAQSFGLNLKSNMVSYKSIVGGLMDVGVSSGVQSHSQHQHSLELSNPLSETGMQLKVDIQLSYDFFKYVVKQLVSTLNNIGVIYVMRNKLQDGLTYFMRALSGRIHDFDCLASLHQAAIIETNISYVYKLLEKYELAGQYLNQAIMSLESSDYNESNQLISLLQLLYNKQHVFGDDLPILAIAYHFYSDILSRNNKEIESQFCRQQYEMLREQPRKILHEDVLLPEPKPKNESYGLTKDENLSTVSFKTGITGSSVSKNGAAISRENIIFQKYIEINLNRFKVVILQLIQVGCIQIILYSKPLNFLKKIIIPYSDLMAHAKVADPQAFAHEKNLENFLKSVVRKLYIRDNELHIKELVHFSTLEEYMQIQNQ